MARKWFVLGKFAGLCGCVSISVVLNLSQVAYSADATVTVNINTTYQTMEGWGGISCWTGYRTDNRARAEALNATNLIADVPYNVMGIGASFSLWEQNNDNSDPLSFNWAAFNDVQKVPEYFGDCKNLGIGTTVLDVGNNPTWWSSDDEKVESIASMIVYTRDHQGTMLTYVSFNNATPALIKKAGVRFAQLGITTKWIVSGGPSNVETFLKDTSISSQLGPVGYYQRDESEPNASLTNLASVAERYGKSVWYLKNIVFGEYKADADADLHGEEYWGIKQYSYAWRLLPVYFNNLKYGHSSCNLYVDVAHPLMGGWDASAVRAPCYYMFKQLVTTFPVGYKVIDATSNNQSVWSLASQKGTSFKLALVNSTIASKTVDVTGLPNGTYSVTLTDSTHKMSSLVSQTVSAGNVTVTLSPQSLTTLSASGATPVLKSSKCI